MKKQLKKKLSLSTETLANMDRVELDRAAGGSDVSCNPVSWYEVCGSARCPHNPQPIYA